MNEKLYPPARTTTRAKAELRTYPGAGRPVPTPAAALRQCAVEPLEGRLFLSTSTARALADAYVRDGSYAGTNYGSATTLQVKTTGRAGDDRDAYLRFNASIPAGDALLGAKLRLRGTGSVGGTATTSTVRGLTVSAFPFQTAGKAWGENTINWNNRPFLAGTTSTASAIATVYVPTTGGAAWRELDVTTYVTTAVSYGRPVVDLGLHAVAKVDAQATFDSDEGANRPQLVLTTLRAPTAAKAAASTSVHLTWSDNSDNETAFQIDRSVNGGTWSPLAAVGPNKTAYYDGGVVAGRTYTYRVRAMAGDYGTSPTTATVTVPTAGGGTGGSVTSTLAPAADSYVRDGSYAGQNFGATYVLDVSSNATGTDRDAYLRFDLSALSGKSVSSARLRLFGTTFKDGGGTSGPVTVSAFPLTNPASTWGETGITFNNRPFLSGYASASTALGSITVAPSSTGRWFEIDLTTFVKGELAAGRTQVSVGLHVVGAKLNVTAQFNSRESGNGPQLAVTTPTPTPTPTTPPSNGTIFDDPDIITAADPSAYTGATYVGQGQRTMFDRRVGSAGAFVTYDAYLVNVTYKDGGATSTVEVEVNPEFGSPAAAVAEAQKYGRVIGQLPAVLRSRLKTVWIHKGTQLFGGGNDNLLIHTGQADYYQGMGILEETLLHEATHTSLDPTVAASAGWRAAQAADGNFVSTYARDNPDREDVAESFLPYLAYRYRSARISASYAAAIAKAIPNRIKYFDGLSLDLRPFV